MTISGLKLDVVEEGGRPIGIRYAIACEGFGLPLHAHSTRDQYHDIRCEAGEVIVFGYGWFKILKPGDVFTEFDNALPHAITSRGPAAWFNMYLNEPPEFIVTMREDEKHTDLNSRVDLPDWLLKELA